MGTGVYRCDCCVAGDDDCAAILRQRASTSSFGSKNADVCLIRTNELGHTSWTRTFGVVGCGVGCGDMPYSVCQTSDGGYVIAGYTNSIGAGGYGVFVIKTDSDGNVQ